MALGTNTVTVSAATTSDHISLPSNAQGRDYVLQCSSTGAYTLDIQMSADGGTTWTDAYYDSSTKVTLDSTGVQSVRVAAGLCYRMDVSAYNSTITMRAVST